ncbi:hypothetical protein TNCV_2576271 [Trichonephila clavipes]|uniref:Uncharacterized protein n=1 Tax=Trichonephila clavipes TaxID=2585209 RepID=A0A8X6REG6_TRICX|nr:hypothetical protein TNCV_2576271 [Trichonephila clavipes]
MTHRNQLFFPQASIKNVFRESSMEASSRAVNRLQCRKLNFGHHTDQAKAVRGVVPSQKGIGISEQAKQTDGPNTC